MKRSKREGYCMLNRRRFLETASGTALLSAMPGNLSALGPTPADHTLQIAPLTLDIGRGVTVQTVAYNGRVPGPTLHLTEGVPVTIDVTNTLAYPEIVHWHGLKVGTIPDGAHEEGSPMIEPGATLRYSFTPRPAGTRWYHTHAMAMDDLSRAAYTGQFGFLFVDGPSATKPQVDHEFDLAIHHWEPSFVPMVETMRAQSANSPQTSGSDVGYKYATLNGKMLGAGEPLRVKRGDRVLLRLLNASATENVVLALPGHTFHILAMDGNPVPQPRSVEVLSLAVAERVDALVEMNAAGRLGPRFHARRRTRQGPRHRDRVRRQHRRARVARPPPGPWDYTQFAATRTARPIPPRPSPSPSAMPAP